MHNINLKLERTKRLWTQEQIAKELGISASAYHQIESGKKEPSMKMARKIASLLNKTLDELFNTDKQQKQTTNTC